MRKLEYFINNLLVGGILGVNGQFEEAISGGNCTTGTLLAKTRQNSHFRIPSMA